MAAYRQRGLHARVRRSRRGGERYGTYTIRQTDCLKNSYALTPFTYLLRRYLLKPYTSLTRVAADSRSTPHTTCRVHRCSVKKFNESLPTDRLAALRGATRRLEAVLGSRVEEKAAPVLRRTGGALAPGPRRGVLRGLCRGARARRARTSVLGLLQQRVQLGLLRRAQLLRRGAHHLARRGQDRPAAPLGRRRCGRRSGGGRAGGGRGRG